MNNTLEFYNETVPLTHMNTILGLLFLIKRHINSKPYTLITNEKSPMWVAEFFKAASEYNLQLEVEEIKPDRSIDGDDKNFLIVGNSSTNLYRLTRSEPKFLVAVFLTNNTELEPPEYLSELVISGLTSFFAVILLENLEEYTCMTPSCKMITGKCYIIYRPIPETVSKAFLTLYYEEINETIKDWRWEEYPTTWDYYRKKKGNMKGITINVGMISRFSPEKTAEMFWTGKNSFYWKILSEHLGFRIKGYFEEMKGKSFAEAYMKLIFSNLDGLGTLPVMSSERDQFVDFIITGLDSKFHLLVRSPQFVYSWQSIFKPLSPAAWMCLGVVILLMTIEFHFIIYRSDFTLAGLSYCFLTIFGFVCCQGSTNIPKSISGRLICYVALIFSISIYQFYTSNFYSILSTKEVSLPFNSLEQLLAKRTHDVYIHPDTVIYSYITNAESGIFKLIWTEILQKDPNHQIRSDTRQTLLDRVCKGKGAILGLPFQILHMIGLKCKLVSVNSGYCPTNIVLIVRKNFPYKSQFDFVNLRLLEGGVTHKFRDEYLEEKMRKSLKTQVMNEPVSFEQVAFLYAFYGASILLSFIILGFEILSLKSSHKLRK